MADFKKSDWQIKHGSTVLLDFDDLISAEPDMSWAQIAQVEPVIDGEHPYIAAKGNVQNDFSFDRVVKKASMEAARNWRLSHSIECAALDKGIVTISVRGGDSYTLSDAVVISGSSTSGVDVSAFPNRAQMSYEIIGGKLEIVAV